MLKIVFSSDWHLGLVTNEIDRTDEIFTIAKQIVQHCKELIVKHGKENVYLILGGDIFNVNTPSEKHIAVFIKVLGLLKNNWINTYVLVGNHEAIADPDRLSCLSFIKAAKAGYPNVTLIEDIKTMKIGTFDTGPLNFTFLPHVSKALIAQKVKKGNLKKEITTQKYIDIKCDRIIKKAGSNTTHYVFSHLNVYGAHGGSEENLLKRSEVYLPKAFTEAATGLVTIVQGHIHTKQEIGNINIIGSPIYCSFGEALDDKCFAEYTFHGEMSKPNEVKYITTKYRPFMELELDMMNETRDFMSIPQVLEFLETLSDFADDGYKPIVKFDVSINPESNTYNWNKIKEDIETDFECSVRNIVPRILIKRPVRSIKQKLGLPIKDSVKIFIKRNLKDDKKRKLVWKYSQQYLEVK